MVSHGAPGRLRALTFSGLDARVGGVVTVKDNDTDWIREWTGCDSFGRCMGGAGHPR